MDFMTAVRTCLSKYVDFSGRARRSEFWYFILFVFLVQIVASILDSVLGTDFDASGNGLISLVATLALFLPQIAVTARRLHDIDKSGWWQLIGIIPIVGWIIMIVWACTDSKADNKYGPNPKTGPAGYEGGYPPPPGQGYPPPGQPPQAPPQPTGEVSLSKDRPVSLQKGQRVTLRKEGGVALTFVKMGLGWDPVRTRGMFGNRTVDIDLDASVCLFADNNLVDVAYYGQLSSKDGSVRHQGDNLTGEGDGDDEMILVDLTRIPAHINSLLFIVTSYKGHTFEQVQNAFCRLIDGSNNGELARYTLAGGMPFTAMAMAKVYRVGADWKMQALGEGFQAKHPGEAVPQLGRFLGGN